MRDIEFRGKRIDTGEWVYGYFIQVWSQTPMITLHEDGANYVYVIDPDTVGQYTGLVDTNGVKIFEGDIVRSTSCMDEVGVGDIYFDRGCWMFSNDGDEPYELYHNHDVENGPTLEVIGNIHDNPDYWR